MRRIGESHATSDWGKVTAVRERIEICYPGHWVAHSPLTAGHRKEISKEIVAWIAEHTPSTPEVLDDVRDMDPGNGTASAYPKADHRQASTIAKYLFYWLSWDDTNIETATGSELNHVEKAIVGEPFADQEPAEGVGRNPYLASWWLIGEEFTALGASPQWRKRLGSFQAWWARRAAREAQVIQGRETYQDFSAALKHRVKTIGPGGNVLPAEITAGYEIPEEVYYSRIHQDLLHRLGRVLALPNDLIGYGKDMAEGQLGSNLLWQHQNLCRTQDVDASILALMELFGQAVEEFDDIASTILGRCSPEVAEGLSVVFDHYRFAAAGFTKWYIEAPRYNQYVHSGEQPWSFFMG
ncbi:terpene synthase family protein [Streptomyces aureoversilis]|uniref:Terpene synthase family protein n=1 Tax=Streptomyces aureoversilis TaxID=67277 RepID=A0ABV9ZVZ1_9ACTN